MQFPVFQFGPISSCPFSGHQWVWLHHLCTFPSESQNHLGWKRPLRSSSPTYDLTAPCHPSDICTLWDPLEPFLPQANHRCLSCSLHDRYSSPFVISVVLCWACCSVCMSLLLESPVLQVRLLSAEQRGGITSSVGWWGSSSCSLWCPGLSLLWGSIAGVPSVPCAPGTWGPLLWSCFVSGWAVAPRIWYIPS